MSSLVDIDQDCSKLIEDFKYFQYNFTISLLSPLGEGRGLSFEQT